ncbi:transposable element Tcb2 transposase [Trichonephila clavipes]|nr:transposable element Tcb2 transposase [Trichonephila clavipes]
MEPRDVIYMKTRLRTPPTDQSLRRPLYRKKCRAASSATIQAIVAPSLGPLCLLEPFEGAWLKDIWDRGANHIQFHSDDNRVRVWRPRGVHLNPAFALQRRITSTARVMIWGTIAYNTRSPLVLIRGTSRAQRYVHDILQPHMLPLMQRLPGAIFQQDNVRPHTVRVSQDSLGTITTRPWPARSPNLSSIEHIWYYLGR